ncbi:glycosyltransferase family 39 protein [Candidatus Poribacteria bacterium]|nr:glycosyltransferase family 39 protein [Candidatus Poribacteria bacterium]
MTPGSLCSRRSFFLLVWLLFIVKSITYIALTPIWEGFDELFHFAYIHSLVSTRSLPVWGRTFIDSEIAQSTAYTPLAGLMPQLAPGFEKLSYRDYWRLEKPRREMFHIELRRLQASSNRFSPSSVQLYQVQHPPLYYALCAPLYCALDGRSIVEKVYATRFFSAFLASLCIVAAALISGSGSQAAPTRGSCLQRSVPPSVGRDLRTYSSFAAYLGGIVALWPCLYIDIARVGNDCLGVAVYSFIFLFMVRFGARTAMRDAVALGVLLGFGLLTKAYFLPAIPALMLFAAFLAIRKKDRWRQILLEICLALSCGAVIGGWWYLRNYRLYGSFAGLQETMYFPSVGVTERIQAAMIVPWGLIAKNLFVTFSWVSGWSFLHLPKPAYVVFAAAFAVAVFGLLRGLSSRSQQPAFGETGFGLIPAVCLIGFFVLGVAYHAVNTYATVRFIGGPGGWYFYALVVPISYAVALGIRQASVRVARFYFAALYLGIMAVEAHGFLMVLGPYYMGLALPSPDGWGTIYPESRTLASMAEVFNRLTSGELIPVSAGLLVLLAASYFVLHITVLLKVLAAKDMLSGS